MSNVTESTGLVLQDRLAFSYEVLNSLPRMEVLEGYSESNEAALKSLFFMGETAAFSHEAENETALEIQRIEMKLNFLIGLFAEQLMLQRGMPRLRDVRVTPTDVSWSEDSNLKSGQLILLHLLIKQDFPKDVVFCCRIVRENCIELPWQIKAIFLHASENSIHWLEKYIFKMHRRKIALTKRHIG